MPDKKSVSVNTRSTTRIPAGQSGNSPRLRPVQSKPNPSPKPSPKLSGSTPKLRMSASPGAATQGVSLTNKAQGIDAGAGNQQKQVPPLMRKRRMGTSPARAEPMQTQDASPPFTTSSDSKMIKGQKMRTRLSTGSIHMNGTTTISAAKEKAELDMIMKQISKSDIAPAAKASLGSSKKRSSGSFGSSTGEEIGIEHPPPKKRKIGRNDGSGEDNRNDYFCWMCHKEGMLVCCELCPRVYHIRCLGLTGELPQDWVCPECEKIMQAECIDTRSKAMEMLTVDQLCILLKYALDRMNHQGSEPFRHAVDPKSVPSYSDYVYNPMDLTMMEKNIKKKQYGCTEAFLSDAKWILHNCTVYNGAHSNLTNGAKMIIKICKHETAEIELCPDCYLNSCIRRNDEWFSEPCRVPHTLVWAKLKGYPFWPAKALREADGQVDVRFFGAHDRSWVPVSQCFLLSKNIPTSLQKGKKNQGLSGAINELHVHINKLRERFGGFEYAPFRTPYDKTDSYKPINIKTNLANSPTFYTAKSRHGQMIKKSSAAKTAFALKSKYNIMANVKKLDASPKKMRRDCGKTDDVEENVDTNTDDDDDDDDDINETDSNAVKDTGTDNEISTDYAKTCDKGEDSDIHEQNKSVLKTKVETDSVDLKEPYTSKSIVDRLAQKIKAINEDSVSDNETDNVHTNKQTVEEDSTEQCSSNSIADKLAQKIKFINEDTVSDSENEKIKSETINVDKSKQIDIVDSTEQCASKSVVDELTTNSISKNSVNKDEDSAKAELICNNEDTVKDTSSEKADVNKKNIVGDDIVVKEKVTGTCDKKGEDIKDKDDETQIVKSDEKEKPETDKKYSEIDDQKGTNENMDTTTKTQQIEETGLPVRRNSNEMESKIIKDKIGNSDKEFNIETGDSNHKSECSSALADKQCSSVYEKKISEDEKDIKSKEAYKKKLESTILSCKAKLGMENDSSDKLDGLSEDDVDESDGSGEDDESSEEESADTEEDMEVAEEEECAAEDVTEETDQTIDKADTTNHTNTASISKDFNKEIEQHKLSKDASETNDKESLLPGACEAGGIGEIVSDTCHPKDKDKTQEHKALNDASDLESQELNEDNDGETILNDSKKSDKKSDVAFNIIDSEQATRALSTSEEIQKDKNVPKSVDTNISDTKQSHNNQKTNDLHQISSENKPRSITDSVAKPVAQDKKRDADENKQKNVKVADKLGNTTHIQIIKQPMQQKRDNKSVHNSDENRHKLKSIHTNILKKNKSLLKPHVRKNLTGTDTLEEDSDTDRLVIDFDSEKEASPNSTKFQVRGGEVQNGAEFKKYPRPLVKLTKVNTETVEAQKHVWKKADTAEQKDKQRKAFSSIILDKVGSISTPFDKKKDQEKMEVDLVGDSTLDSQLMSGDECEGSRTVDIASASSSKDTKSGPPSTATPVRRPPSPSVSPANKLANKFSKKLMSAIQHTLDEMYAEVIEEKTQQHSQGDLQQQLDHARWRYNAELTEMKHNFKLTIAEMKELWEAEKKQLRKSLAAKHEIDIAETKKKQWCAQCGKEAIFYCCWNTSYCDYPCQQNHWPQHMLTCLQTNKDKANSVKSTTATTQAATVATSQTLPAPVMTVTGASSTSTTPSTSATAHSATISHSTQDVKSSRQMLQDQLSAALYREEEKRGEMRAGVSPKYIPMSSPGINQIPNPHQSSTAAIGSGLLFPSNLTSTNQIVHPSQPAMMQQIPRNMYINQQIPLQSQPLTLPPSRSVNNRMLLGQPVMQQQAMYPIQLPAVAAQNQQANALGGAILFQNQQQQGIMGYGMRPPY